MIGFAACLYPAAALFGHWSWVDGAAIAVGYGGLDACARRLGGGGGWFGAAVNRGSWRVCCGLVPAKWRC